MSRLDRFCIALVVVGLVGSMLLASFAFVALDCALAGALS